MALSGRSLDEWEELMMLDVEERGARPVIRDLLRLIADQVASDTERWEKMVKSLDQVTETLRAARNK